VHNAYRQPGGEDEVERLESALLRDAGHALISYRRDSAEIERWGALRRATLPLRAAYAWDSVRELRELIARERPEVAHFTNTFPLISPAAYRVCREAGVAVVQSLHNFRLLCPAATFLRDGAPCERCVEHSLFESVRYACYQGSRLRTAALAAGLAAHRSRGTFERDVDLYLTPSEFARGRFAAGGLPAERIRVKPNFAAPDPGLRRGRGAHALFAGRLAHYKGADLALRALARLPAPPPLVVAGDGPQRAELEALARELGVDARFTGQLGREALLEQLELAAYLVFPSRCYESFGLAAVWAFARGVPVIAPAQGSLPEIVRDGRNGRLFRAGDAEDLARVLAWAAAEPEALAALGAEARRDYEERYAARPQRKLLEDLYAEAQILAQRPR